jgi:hypothetical protein
MSYNLTEALSQSTLVQNQITCYQGSSLTSIFETIATLAKITERLVYKMTLLSTEVYILRVVNKILSKRYRAKKTLVYQEETLIVEDT